MIERPILFSGAMVRALLDGSKTQTRRTMKPQPVRIEDSTILQWRDGLFQPERMPANSNLLNHCPYGQPGDRLWVRETYADAGCRPTYRADLDDGAHCKVKKWTPAIHMFRADSRILLEVTSVRVERLQDISEADAKAEGARRFPDIPMGLPSANPCRWSMETPTNTDQCLSTARYAFANYFCKVNGKGRRGIHDPAPWGVNPWVWVVEFKRVQP